MIIRSRRIWVYLLLAASLTVLVIFYQGNNSLPKAETITIEQNCRMVQHAMGVTCVPDHPQRVVTLSTMDLANALALGIKPIATANDFRTATGEFPPYLSSHAQGIPTLGNSGQPNLEKILYLKPDLIFSWWGSPPKSINPLVSKIAPTVAYSWWESSWKEIFNSTAQLLGKEQAAQVAWQHYQTKIQDLKTALGNRYQDKKISFIYFYFGRIGTNVNNSFAGSILKDAGLQRPPDQDRVIEPYGYTEFSLEEINQADGDVLFVASFTDDDQKVVENLQRNPLWQTLKAVQQKQVYFVSGVTWIWGSDMIGAEAVIDDLRKYLVEVPDRKQG
ncbi:iron-siderophore ABC transporter substrate-binding protein [Chlorogloeopsis sp. ULAP01]|uniref:ABC transporter substrate-binding protein n=1 Tax=Chlorogloeopsis sp. ULAP01 TaxID=3056483 RepID=UPI0025AA5959|nr:iron-siderophore ABC transporter substrate-binding protein [Chlorogloeopsis sp. ULAP01]MDM9379748.1 iron-siderophore ABC transporter substrate-binding protein [Chlorogloeopsis sp. ULAP01]